jgi:hypothetical protein
MNKTFIMAGIVVSAISKAIILKSILVDTPAYEECVSRPAFDAGAPFGTCGIDPFIYFAIGWLVTVGGFILIVVGFKMPAIRKIPR